MATAYDDRQNAHYQGRVQALEDVASWATETKDRFAHQRRRTWMLLLGFLLVLGGIVAAFEIRNRHLAGQVQTLQTQLERYTGELQHTRADLDETITSARVELKAATDHRAAADQALQQSSRTLKEIQGYKDEIARYLDQIRKPDGALKQQQQPQGKAKD
jgi:hypothetical protein